MTKTTKIILISGIIFGLGFSVVSSLIFMIFAQTASGGLTSFWGESWLYFATLIPFMVTFPLLGFYLSKQALVTNQIMWLSSFISAFLVTLYSGTIGAIFGEYIVRGSMETINIEGTLIWGTIYAFSLLPATALFAKIIFQVFLTFLTKMGVVKSIYPYPPH